MSEIILFLSFSFLWPIFCNLKKQLVKHAPTYKDGPLYYTAHLHSFLPFFLTIKWPQPYY